ncbi:MAG: DUF115 domain-containing protein [bacterium]|nr:DUF115 domain-containing protein [bacterium]
MIRKLYYRLSKLKQKVTSKLYHNTIYMKLRFSLFSIGEIKENLIIFECNFGRGYYGQLRAIYEAMLSNPDYYNFYFIWSVRNYSSNQSLLEKERTGLAKIGTPSWLKAYAKAKYIITNKPVSTLVHKRPGQCYILCSDELLDYGTARYPAMQWPQYDYEVASTFGKLLNRYKTVSGANKLLLGHYTANSHIATANLKDSLISTITQDSIDTALQNIRFKRPGQSFQIVGTFLENTKVSPPLNSRYYQNNQYYFCKPGPSLDYYVLLHIADLIVTDSIGVVHTANTLKKHCIYVNSYGRTPTISGLYFTEVKSFLDVYMLLSLASFTNYSYRSIDLYAECDHEESFVNSTEYYAAIGKNINLPASYETLFGHNEQICNSMDTLLKSLIRPVLNTVSVPYHIKRGKSKKLLKAILKSIDTRLYQWKLTVSYLIKKTGHCLTTNDRKLLSYKNKFQGERCFLIGNGPSLTTNDLELLQNEYTFACNRIYKLFSATTWRPSFYCLIDGIISKYESNDIARYIRCPIFTNKSISGRLMKKGNIDDQIIYSNNLGLSNYKISKDFFNYYIPSGATVMTYMIELAIYMGFKEIYLLGVDCTSSITTEGGHCVNNYISPEILDKDKERIRKRLGFSVITNEDVADYYFNKSTFAYRIIKHDLANEHKEVNIINATRGGMLEVFERTRLEDVV